MSEPAVKQDLLLNVKDTRVGGGGLASAKKDVDALNAALALLQKQATGGTKVTVPKLSLAELETQIKAAQKLLEKGVQVRDVDPKELMRKMGMDPAVLKLYAAELDKLKKSFAGDFTGGKFSGIEAAARRIHDLNERARKEQEATLRGYSDVLKGMFGGGGKGGGKGVTADGPVNVTLAPGILELKIDPARLTVTLLPGPLNLNVGGGTANAAANQNADGTFKEGNTAGGDGRKKRKKAPAGTTPDGDGAETRRVVKKDADGDELETIVTRRLDALRTVKTTSAGGDVTGSVLTEDAAKALREGIEAQLKDFRAGKAEDYRKGLTGDRAADARALAALLEKQAAGVEGLVKGSAPLGAAYSGGLRTTVEELRLRAAEKTARADRLDQAALNSAAREQQRLADQMAAGRERAAKERYAGQLLGPQASEAQRRVAAEVSAAAEKEQARQAAAAQRSGRSGLAAWARDARGNMADARRTSGSAGEELVALQKMLGGDTGLSAPGNATQKLVAGGLAKRMKALNDQLLADQQAMLDEAARTGRKLDALDQQYERRNFRGAKARATEARRFQEEHTRDGQIGMAKALADQHAADLKAQGFKLRKGGNEYGFDAGGNRRVETMFYDRTKDGKTETVRFKNIYEGARLAGVGVKDLGEKMAALGTRGKTPDFLSNTEHVTRWAASVGVLYTALNLGRRALSEFLSLSYEMARLDQVYQKVGGSTAQLTDDILRLAAANGRNGSEALQAATAWARLGLTKAQTFEAVRVSLLAANVAELDALQATKFLQSSMAAYGLSVRDLSGYLAGLNYISNVWNVTNADLLEGISKTASVAKQAGLPLEELRGLLGAAVGTSGQSGANLGNAFKSVITALSNPVLQAALRKDFKLEVTTGDGGDIKNMSQLLADLFVKYQALTNLERQNLLFQVAGKTQSSKLTAILDSYIRGQVLATNAMLNLNSAEAENAKIKATLRAELAGVVTEFDRFVLLQGKLPAAGLAGAAGTLKNALSFANLPGVSGAMTGFLGLLAALSARLLLTKLASDAASTALDKGWAGNSINRVRTLVQGLGTDLQKLATHFGGVNGHAARFDRWLASSGQRAIGLGRVNIRQGQLMPSVMDGRSTLGPAVAGLAFRTGGALQVAAGGAQRGLGMAGRLALGGALTAAALGPEILAGVAATAAITYGFNRAMEAAGRSSDDAERKLAGFNENLGIAEGKAKAAASALKLLDTAARALPTMRPGDRAGLLGTLADLEGEGGQGTRLLSPELLASIGQAASAPGATSESIRAAMGPVRGALLQQVYRQQQVAFEEKGNELQTANDEIARLESRPAAFRDENLLKQWQGKKAEILNARVVIANSMAEGDAVEKVSGFDTKRLAVLERQKVVLGQIAQIYENLSGASPLEKLNTQALAHEANIAYYDERERFLKAEQQAAQAEYAAADEEPKRLEAQAKLYAEKAASLGTALRGAPSALLAEEVGDYTTKAGEARAQAARLRAGKANPTLFNDSLLKANAEARDREREAAEANRSAEAQAVARRSAEFGDVQRATRRQIAGFGVGDTEGAKLLDTQQRVVEQIAALQDRLNQKGRDANDVAKDRVRLAEMLQAQLQNQEAIEDRITQNQKDQAQLAKDQARAQGENLLRSSPGDLLKRFAAQRYNALGFDRTAGGFLAAGGLRPFLDELPGQGTQARRLREEERELKGYRPRDRGGLRDEVIRNQNEFGAEERKAMAAMARFAAVGLENVANAAGRAASKFEEVTTSLAGVITRLDAMGGGRVDAILNVTTPQGGGLGGGEYRPRFVGL